MRSLIAAACLLTAFAAPLSAQMHPQTRQGFWISFGFGYGSLSCEGCRDRLDGQSGYLRMGGTVSPQFLLGGEATGWSKTEGNTTLTVANVGPVFHFYPSATGGFFIKGGLGVASAKLESGRFSGETTGAGLTLGVGWDARVGSGFALTPYFDLMTSHFDAGSLDTFAFGLGFTWP